MAMTLITTNTESGDASSSFTSSIDSTYKLYIFKFIDVNAASDAEYFQFNGSTDGGSNYNVTKTTTVFAGAHNENDAAASLNYTASSDVAQGTGYQILTSDCGSGADESAVGTLWLFNPSNTTYVKHFYSRFNNYASGNSTNDVFAAGYFNTTSAINAVDFKMSSGNMDGVISMWGVG